VPEAGEEPPVRKETVDILRDRVFAVLLTQAGEFVDRIEERRSKRGSAKRRNCGANASYSLAGSSVIGSGEDIRR
jgi:hypothetical protein